jgi:hypothetical protein
MATKKTRKKQTKLKKAAAKRKPMKKTVKKRLAAKKKPSPKAKQKLAVKKTAVKTRAAGKKTTGGKTAGASRKRLQGKTQSANIESFAPEEEVRARSAGQSGDLQGLSDTASADSESVDQLIEEGNAFEAEVVSGVEAADRGDEQEVHTHEVPEDDVPGEYLDKE